MSDFEKNYDPKAPLAYRIHQLSQWCDSVLARKLSKETIPRAEEILYQQTKIDLIQECMVKDPQPGDREVLFTAKERLRYLERLH
jgi:hypothetical protein